MKAVGGSRVAWSKKGVARGGREGESGPVEV